jgi:3-oxoacyl-[acyl-carrier-protein] synthase II
MKVYIRSAGNISPQHSLDTNAFFTSRIKTTTDFFNAIEPDYDQFVDSKMIRRMSRIVKMGVAASITCLRNAGIEMPSAIITATAYGCLEDSSVFLRKMIEFEEKMLSPTAFIQSTHNTVGAQIALLLKCHHYNNCIVHRAFSFENALIEAKTLLEDRISPVLVGAVDEITNDRHAILSRFGLYRKDEKTTPNIAGEGAAFFLLSYEPGNKPLAVLSDVHTMYEPENLQTEITEFLKRNGLSEDQVGLILSTRSGKTNLRKNDETDLNAIFPGKPDFPFKSLSGDYPTASGFALWFASLLLNEQRVPAWMNAPEFPLKNIFIHHHDGNLHHSFFLISSC